MSLDPKTPISLPESWPPLMEAGRAAALETFTAAPIGAWGGPLKQRLIEGQTALLADLGRPASRDHWARMLAHWVGMTVGVTAPSWIRWNDHGDGRFTWILGTYTQTILFAPESRGWHQTYTTRYVPELLDLPNPEAALRAALFSVHPEAADAP